jgi:hypothetical protein
MWVFFRQNETDSIVAVWVADGKRNQKSKGKIGNMIKALFKHGCRKSPDLTLQHGFGECVHWGVLRRLPNRPKLYY